MALNLGELTVWLTADTKQFSSSLATATRQLDQVAASARRASVEAGAALAAMGLTANKLVSAASDANELYNVMEQSFGNMTREVNQWAVQTAQAMGRSNYQMRQFAGTTQALLAPMLGDRKAAAEMSKQIAQLAVDLGSFWNVADDEALQALKSGLVGEAEPLRRFGVNLLDSNLQLEAQRLGIKKNVQQMTEAEKVQLRWALILRQTKDAQGDAVRTADSYANQVKRLQGNIRNLTEDLGYGLLPYSNRFVHALNDLTQRFGTLDVETKDHIIRMGALAAAVLGVVVAIGPLVSAVAVAAKGLHVLALAAGLVTSPWLLLSAVILVALAAIAGAWEKYGGQVQDTAGRIWKAIQPLYEALKADVSGVWKWAVETAGDAYEWIRDTAWPLIGQTVQTIWKWSVEVAGDAYHWLRDQGPAWIGKTVSTTWKWAVTGFESVRDGIESIHAWAGATLSTTWNWVVQGWDAVQTALNQAAPWIGQTVDTAWRWTVTGLQGLPESLAGAAKWAGQTITTTWDVKVVPTVDELRAWVAGLSDALDSAAERVRNFQWPELAKPPTFELPVFRWPDSLPDLPPNWKGQVEQALAGWEPTIRLEKAVAQIQEIGTRYRDGSITLGEAVKEALDTEVGMGLGTLALLALPLPWPLKIAVAAVNIIPAEDLSIQGLTDLAKTVWAKIQAWFAPGGSARGLMEAAASRIHVPADILGAISVAENSDQWLMGVKSFTDDFKAKVDALTQELWGGVFDVHAPEFQVAAAAISMKNYWEKFAQVNVEAAKTSFENAGPQLKEAFLQWVAPMWAPTEGTGLTDLDRKLNPNWPRNAIAGLKSWQTSQRLNGIIGRAGFQANKALDTLTLTVPVKLQAAADWATDVWNDVVLPKLRDMRDSLQKLIDSISAQDQSGFYAEYGLLYMRYNIAPVIGAGLGALRQAGQQVRPLALSLDEAIGRTLDLSQNREFDWSDVASGLKLALRAALVDLPAAFQSMIGETNLVANLEDVWNSNVAKVIKLALAAKFAWEALEPQLEAAKKALLESKTYQAIVSSVGLKFAIGADLVWGLAPTEFKKKVADFLNSAFGTHFKPDDFALEILISAAAGVAGQAAVTAGQSLATALKDAILRQLALGGGAAGIISAVFSNGAFWFTIGAVLTIAVLDVFLKKSAGEVMRERLEELNKNIPDLQAQAVDVQKTIEAATKAGNKNIVAAQTEQLRTLQTMIAQQQQEQKALLDKSHEGNLLLMANVVQKIRGSGWSAFKGKTAFQPMLGAAIANTAALEQFQKTFDSVMADIEKQGYFVSQQFMDSIQAVLADAQQPLSVLRRAAGDLKINVDLMFSTPENMDAIIRWLQSQLKTAKGDYAKNLQNLLKAVTFLRHPYAEGGFTPDVGISQAAGIVHGGEWVAPAWMIRRFPWLFADLERARRRGYREGGPVGNLPLATGNAKLDAQVQQANTMVEQLQQGLNAIVDTLQTGFTRLFGWLGDLLVGLATKLFPEQVKELQSFWEQMKASLGQLFGPLTPEERQLASGQPPAVSVAESEAVAPLVLAAPRFSELIRQWIGELPNVFKLGITHLQAWGKNVADSARQLRDWRKTLSGLDKAAGAAAIKLLNLGKQTASNLWDRLLADMPIAQDAMQAYAEAGGGMSGLAAALASIIQNSETYQNLLAIINPLLQAFADALGSLLEPLLPVIQIVSDVLTPVFRLLGVILGNVFTPILEALFPVFKILGLAILYISRGIAWAYNAIVKAINWALGWLGVHLNEIPLKDFDAAIKALSDTTWDETMSRAKEKKAIDSVTASLRNVPQGFKVALERFRAAVGEPLAGVQAAWATNTSGNVTVIIEGDVYGMDDFDRRVQTAVASAQRKSVIGRFGLATGGA